MVGTTVILYDKVKTGVDAFNHPVYDEIPVVVENVLIAPTSTDDIVSYIDMEGKKAVYTLGIPKGDTHEWESRKIEFFGHTFKSFGFVIEGIEQNIPTPWHKKVMVERYG